MSRRRAIPMNAAGIGLLLVLLAALLWLNTQWAAPRDIEFVIPRGTAQAIEDGSETDAIPRKFTITEGDRLTFVNEDEWGHRIGGIYVEAGSSTTARFGNAGVFEYACSAHETGYTVFEVEERRTLSAGMLAGIALAGGGLLVNANVFATPWRTRRTRLGMLSAGMFVMAAGLVLAGLQSGAFVSNSAIATGPGRTSPESIAAGSLAYQRFCVTCHGDTGLGDGPLAPGMDPPPSDLVEHVPQHSDLVLFEFISDGFPATGMPAFEGSLTEDETWDLVAYLRTIP